MTMKPIILWIALAACTHEPREVVFICEHGAAKSVIASEYFNKLAAERGLAVRAVARGAAPQDKLSVAAVGGLRSDGIAPQLAAPRPVAAADLRGATQIVAFDCKTPAMTAFQGMDACWDDVPTVGDDYGRARDAIRAHVAAMLDQLAR